MTSDTMIKHLVQYSHSFVLPDSYFSKQNNFLANKVYHIAGNNFKK